MVQAGLVHDGPVAVRYPRGSSLGVPLDSEPIPLEIGQGELLAEGQDVAIVAIGAMVSRAMEAAVKLREDGISVAVVNARFVKPLDKDLIREVAKNVKCLVTVEEGCRMGGFGSAVLEFLSEEECWDLPTKVIALPDWYVEQGPQDLLREKYGLMADGIYDQAKALYDRVVLKTILR